MLSGTRPLALVAVLASAALFCQTAPGHPDSTTHPDSPAHPDSATHPNNVAIEFPVVMRQNIIAGKTPVGTRVQAKLTLATFVKGVVIPEDATLSGEVIESAAKSASDPSRLSIRMDSAQWKNGSVPISLPINVYLTAWYYPVELATADPRSGNRHGSIGWGGGDPYPSRQPFPGSGPGSGDDPGRTTGNPPQSILSKHRVQMKDVESTRNDNDKNKDKNDDKNDDRNKDKNKDKDGAIVLTSKRFNIKLDKSTTYVLATGDLAANHS